LHISLFDAEGRLAGACPLYAKSHSQGEYVFDHAFAEAYQRAGRVYYPKLQCAIPFTPATGRRLLTNDAENAEEIRNALIAGMDALREKIGASSMHATFLTRADQAAFSKAGYLLRYDQQFHFTNPGYRDGDDFLADLTARKRKSIKRERRDALANGISVEILTGSALCEAHWDAFFSFYQDTSQKKWGRPYLNRAFFSAINASMADRTVLILAKRAGRYIAGALNFIGANTLYGRNWGAIEEHPFLHFELCYYQAIDFAIARGLSRIEAGAQGAHKITRGYAPVKTVSAHIFSDSGFHKAVAAYLEHEKRDVDAAQRQLERETPFRKT
jgi:uncharacterized protein